MPKPKPSKDSVERVKTDLEIDESIDLHEKGWIVQRIGLGLIFLLIALAAAGFFGDGVVSKTTESSGETKVESERFYRHEARMELKVSVMNPEAGEVRVAFPVDYLQNFRVESIVPEPSENQHANGKVSYLFKGTGDMKVTFFLIPNTRGSIDGTIEVNDNAFELTHFIYP